MDKFLIKIRILELIDIIYNEYDSTGGKLHIVLDDNNIEDEHIKWCLENAISKITNEKEKQVYTECAELLLKLSYSSRKRMFNKYNKFQKQL